MTDPQKDIDRLQREIDQARSNAAKARQGQPTEVISQRKISKRVFALVLPIVLIGIAWVIEIVDQTFFAGSLNFPVSPGGPLWGIITAPFSHMDWGHLIGNTLYFIPLSYLVLLNGLSHYLTVWSCVIVANALIYFFWPIGYHGMSSVVYGLVGYLMVIGFVERRLISLALTVFAFVTYAHFVPTLLPWVSPPGISWIGHFLGFTAGVVSALGMFREDHTQEPAQ